MKVLAEGLKGALVLIENDSKYELVSCYGFDRQSMSWAQGHYFTWWKKFHNDLTKEEIEALAWEHFNKNYR